MKPTLQTESRKIFKTSNVGDYVMVRIYPKQFHSGTVKMLHVRSVGPFKIFNKLNCNNYVIDLPRDYGISCSFNVNDLVNYKDFDCNSLINKLPLNHFLRAPYLFHSQILILLQQRVDKILEDETITTKSGGTHMYLIRWKAKAPTIDLRLDRGDLQRIDPVQGNTISPDSTGSSFLPPWENDADIQS